MKTSTILKKAKALIADPKMHLGPESATPDGFVPAVVPLDGRPVGHKPPWSDAGPCKFCAIGAVWDAAESHNDSVADVTHKAALDIFGMALVDVNDTQGYDAVHIVLDEAIKRAKAAGD